MKSERAFTLIEILVAVAILAVALAATTRAANVATDGALETRQRLPRHLGRGEPRRRDPRARRIFPAAGEASYDVTQGGLALVIDEVVSETPNPPIRKVDLAVADARDPARILTHLTAYVSP